MEMLEVAGLIVLGAVIVVLFLKNKSISSELEGFKQMVSAKQSLEVLNATLRTKLESLVNIETEKMNLKNLLDTEISRRNELEVNISKLTTSLQEQKEKYGEYKSSSEQIISDLKQNIQQNKIEADNWSRELTKAKSQIAELETKVSESTTNFQVMMSNKDEFITDLKADLFNKNQTVENYNNEIKSYKSQIAELETKVNEGAANLSKLLNAKDETIFDLKASNSKLSAENKIFQTQITNDNGTISTLQTQLDEQTRAMEDKLLILQNSEAKLKVEFENLANRIFQENNKKFSEQQKNDLGLILNPMKEQIGEFKKKVEEVYNTEALQRNDLKNELKTLKELNLKMSDEANKLTAALTTDNKKQGNWGEMVLDSVLENSGLRAGHEYHKQTQLKDEENNTFKPDVIVNLPDNRDIVIDAKTSLNAYKEYMAEPEDNLKITHLKNHVKSIKDHINGLANKKYESLKGINTLDFIFMFIPIEGALLLALDNDVNLYDDAFKKKIILVSPTTLLVALRAVENTWRYARQAQNIVDVSRRAELLYAKFNGFVEDMNKIGENLVKADESYKKAFGKLSQGDGNLIWQATELKSISNIKPKKELDNQLVNRAVASNDMENEQ